ncbi:hypothetical protein F5Y13DRAFT_129774 [Hypoxylon sp. FL1857]|nr:hypothetical protein F5Y13DRAFT_129774 [Hypoxylon sp. FL1857]
MSNNMNMGGWFQMPQADDLDSLANEFGLSLDGDGHLTQEDRDQIDEMMANSGQNGPLLNSGAPAQVSHNPQYPVPPSNQDRRAAQGQVYPANQGLSQQQLWLLTQYAADQVPDHPRQDPASQMPDQPQQYPAYRAPNQPGQYPANQVSDQPGQYPAYQVPDQPRQYPASQLPDQPQRQHPGSQMPNQPRQYPAYQVPDQPGQDLANQMPARRQDSWPSTQFGASLMGNHGPYSTGQAHPTHTGSVVSPVPSGVNVPHVQSGYQLPSGVQDGQGSSGSLPMAMPDDEQHVDGESCFSLPSCLQPCLVPGCSHCRLE